MIIDFHTHCYLNTLAARAIARRPLRLPGLPNGTLRNLVADMDRFGIARSVILHLAHRPDNQRDVNSYAASIQSDRLICFGSVHPLSPDALEELERIRALGLAGVKLHPLFQRVAADDPRCFPVYERIGQLGLPVVFHCGISSNPDTAGVCRPQQIERALPHFLNAPVICAHLGGIQNVPEQLSCLKQLPVYTDISYCAASYPQDWVEKVLNEIPSERILFGSDTPWDSPGHQLDQLRACGLPAETMENILWKNAHKLLNRSV